MFGTDPDQMERRLSQWVQGFTDKVEQFRTMRTQIEEIHVTDSSADGAVQVTIDSRGALTDLALTEKINGRPPSEVATQVLACVRRAQQRLAARVHEAMVATVGDQEQVVEHVVSEYRQRFGDDQQSPRPPARRHRVAPPADDEDFSDHSYLR